MVRRKRQTNSLGAGDLVGVGITTRNRPELRDFTERDE